MSRSEEIEAALETAENCRLDASRFRQMGFSAYADYLLKNAKSAELWASRR